MTSKVDYTLTRGMPWERLVIVKNRRTRRVLRPSEAWGSISTGPNTSIPINIEITSEGGLALYLSEQDTLNLPTGDLSFDVVAKVSSKSSVPSIGWREVIVPVVAGTISVSDSGLITDPTVGAVMNFQIKFAEGEDYYTSFLWKDGDDSVLTVTDAYMQAKDDAGTTVLDIRWYQTPPNESAISALPGERRGYLTVLNDSSLELHISDLNSVPAGTYSYDLFVQGAANQWTRLVRGSVIIDPSVSVRP